VNDDNNKLKSENDSLAKKNNETGTQLDEEMQKRILTDQKNESLKKKNMNC